MSEQSEALKRELYRRSQNEVMIHNPTDNDFVFKYGGFSLVVPSKKRDIGFGKGNLITTQDRALNYVKHMTDFLINKEADEKAAKAKAKYSGHYWPEEELKINQGTFSRENRMEKMKLLFKGIVREFGMVDVPSEPEPRKSGDTRPMHEIMLEEIGLIDSRGSSLEVSSPEDELVDSISQ